MPIKQINFSNPEILLTFFFFFGSEWNFNETSFFLFCSGWNFNETFFFFLIVG